MAQLLPGGSIICIPMSRVGEEGKWGGGGRKFLLGEKGEGSLALKPTRGKNWEMAAWQPPHPMYWVGPVTVQCFGFG